MMEFPIAQSDGEVRDVEAVDGAEPDRETEGAGEESGSDTEPEGSVGTEAIKALTHAA